MLCRNFGSRGRDHDDFVKAVLILRLMIGFDNVPGNKFMNACQFLKKENFVWLYLDSMDAYRIHSVFEDNLKNICRHKDGVFEKMNGTHFRIASKGKG